MLETFSVSLTALLSVFCVIFGGFVLRQKGILTKETDRTLLKVVVNFLMPCLILDRILPSDIFSDWRNLCYPPIIGFGSVFLGIAVGAAVGLLPEKWNGLGSRKRSGTFAACVGIFNYGFVPIPLVQLLFGDGDPTMNVLFVQNLGVEFALWTVGLLAIRGAFERDSWKQAINGPTVAILLAVPLNLFFRSHFCPSALIEGLPYLAFLKHAMHMLGVSAIPMSMILIGATIADHWRIGKYFKNPGRPLKIAFWSCLLRLVILPGAMIGLAIYLPCSVELKRVIVLHAAMGSAVFPIVMSQHYGGDQETALDTVLSNTFASILTLPLWVAFGLYWIQ